MSSSLLQTADYVVIAVMMCIFTGVGIYFRFTGGRQKTTLEFLMADKNMKVFPVTFSVMATIMSGISVLGLPAESYMYGTQILMKEVTYSIAVAIVAYQMVPVYFETDVNTIHEYLGRRFGRGIKIVVSLLWVVQMTLYMPIVIFAPSLALNLVTGMSLWASVISVAVICTFYSTLGGLKAVLWTDLFQGMLMFVSIFALIIKGSLDYGGFSNVLKTAEEGGRLELFNTDIDITVRFTVWNTLAQGLILGLFMNGSSFPIVQRLMSCGDMKKAQASLMWSIPLCLIYNVALFFLGIAMYSYYRNCDPVSSKVVTSGDQLTVLFINEVFGDIPGLPGLCIAGILSASLSTMSSVVNSLVALTLEDYIKHFTYCRNLKESTAAILAKFLAILYGGLFLFMTILIANAKGVIETAFISQGIIGGPSFGIFFLGMFTATANEYGAFAGLVAGVAITSWIGFGSLYSRPKDLPLPLSTAACPSNLSDISLGTLYGTNFTSEPEILNFANSSSIIHTDERYIFPLYKMSYFWIAVFSVIATVIVGYAISLVISFYKPIEEVEPQYLSPVLRKWLCKLPELQVTKEYVELPQSLNQIEKNGVLNEHQTENHLL